MVSKFSFFGFTVKWVKMAVNIYISRGFHGFGPLFGGLWRLFGYFSGIEPPKPWSKMVVFTVFLTLFFTVLTKPVGVFTAP